MSELGPEGNAQVQLGELIAARGYLEAELNTLKAGLEKLGQELEGLRERFRGESEWTGERLRVAHERLDALEGAKRVGVEGTPIPEPLDAAGGGRKGPPEVPEGYAPSVVVETEIETPPLPTKRRKGIAGVI